MGQRSSTLAEQFEQAIAELTEAIEKYPDDKWFASTGPEGWNVAALAQHVSGQFPLEMEYLNAAAEGRPLPTYSWDDVNAKNDGRAAQNTKATKAEVLRELRENAAAAAAVVRGLSDEQLDARSPLALANGAEVTLQQLIEGGILIDHARAHLASIRAAG